MIVSWFFSLLLIPVYVLSGNGDGNRSQACKVSDDQPSKAKKGRLKMKAGGLKLVIPASTGADKPSTPGRKTPSKSLSPDSRKNSPITISTATKYILGVDLDKCLLERDITGEINQNPFSFLAKEDRYKVEDDDFAIKDISQQFNGILEENPDVAIGILSFGFEEVAKIVVNHIVSERFRDEKRSFVLTPKSCGGVDGTNGLGDKTQMFEKLTKNKILAENIIFFDDDEHIIESAKKLGVEAVLAAPFTDAHIEQARRFFNAKKESIE